jgi:hypothetical protein
MNEIATKGTWKNTPIDNPKRIDIDLVFTVKQFSKLRMGLIPQQMEDKWFIYYEKDWLYFHRSWTGDGIYKAKLNKITDGYAITEFWAERNQEKHRNENDNADITTFSFLIARGLLGIDVRNMYSSISIRNKWRKRLEQLWKFAFAKYFLVFTVLSEIHIAKQQEIKTILTTVWE